MCILKSFSGFKVGLRIENLRIEGHGPLNISVSRETECSSDISQVNLIVEWNELAKSTK